ncbi:hypothetical protein [Amycolatopsis arida]|uniref:hypothetical protein n=1 Tax=Amycolatopsis arida TaxID=587909 RepID=UPI001065EE9A|nr:hypothetical protein [Amycolatopsis arida]TDX84960.1 hypothetical protein CLV69_11744 [Amycolatopsis arida]
MNAPIDNDVDHTATADLDLEESAPDPVADQLDDAAAVDYGDARLAAPLLLALVAGLAVTVAVLSPVTGVTWAAATVAAVFVIATARTLRGDGAR